MEIAVLGYERSWYVADLQRAGAERGHRLTRLSFPRLVMGYQAGAADFWSDLNRLLAFDAVIVRTMPPGTLEQVVFRMDALAQLETAGVIVVNSPKSLECGVDKFLTTARLKNAGLPVPDTIVCEQSDDALAAFEKLGGDVLVKPLFGAEGRGILRVSDTDLAWRTFRTLERLGAVIYIQRFLEHPGYDVRVMVLDGEILGAVKRHGEDYRTNLARAGRAEVHEPDDIEREFALRSADAVGARFAGVDLLTDRDGKRYVIEVNAVPGWQGFRRATGCDVAQHLICAIEK